MKWTFATDLRAFPEVAEAWLHRDPAASTIQLTAIARMRRGLWDDDALLGWLSDGTATRGVMLHTRGYPLLIGDLPPAAARGLAAALRERRHAVPAVSGPLASVEAFASAWHRRERSRMSMRLYRLAALVDPRPMPAGTPRIARPADQGLVTAWFRAFLAEAEPGADDDPAPQVRLRIGMGEIVLWEAGGRDVSMAAFSGPIAGMSRIGPVYTPPGDRRHGYGIAVTHAATLVARKAGADVMVLFTDLSNPTSNSIYQALGYRPLADHATIHFA